MSGIVTDLNKRERERYAIYFERMAKDAEELAAALRAEEDTQVLISLVKIAITDTPLRELIEVFQATAPVDIPNDIANVNKKR